MCINKWLLKWTLHIINDIVYTYLVIVCLQYPSKFGRLHQSLDYIVYSQCCIDFDCITEVLKE